LHSGVRIARAALLCAAAVAVGVLLVSGGSDADPQTPPALPGLPPPFLGTALSGGGELTAAVDAYGDVVDLRAPGPAGAALIDNPSDRQAAGTVPTDTGIVPRVRLGDGKPLPMWRADSVTQRYLPGTNVVRTVARFGGTRVVMTTAAAAESLAVDVRIREGVGTGDEGSTAGSSAGRRATSSFTVDVEGEVHCGRERRAGALDLLCRVGRALPPVPAAAAGDGVLRACARLIRSAARDDRRWLARSRPLGSAAPGRGRGARAIASDIAIGGDDPRGGSRPPRATVPGWARSMYRRSLLTIHALTSRATGAVAAGARDGWAYVWPRDAATAALALSASGHRGGARHIAHFLTDLDLSAAARFDESGAPIPGRAAQGDAAGWVDAAATATGVPAPHEPFPWRDRSDYQEATPGTYLGNALAAAAANLAPSAPRDGVDGPKTGDIGRFSARQHRAVGEAARIGREFRTESGLVRSASDPGSGLDSAAGWAVRPFGLTALYPAAERTLLWLARRGTRYGITPGEGWEGGEDPWMAPTAWSAWALAALSTEARRADAPRTGASGPRTNLHALREREAHSPPSRSADLRRAAADRHAALSLLADLRCAATPAGDLPERVGAHTGIPTSTTPLLWSSAFAVLALRELWG
jgi:glucoamylase